MSSVHINNGNTILKALKQRCLNKILFLLYNKHKMLKHK